VETERGVVIMIASIDYEKVNMLLLSLIQSLNGIETMAVQAQISGTETSEFVIAVDRFRDAVALEIEIQGKR
jgi:hypothetical protein